jgi:hypothetical protein
MRSNKQVRYQNFNQLITRVISKRGKHRAGAFSNHQRRAPSCEVQK